MRTLFYAGKLYLGVPILSMIRKTILLCLFAANLGAQTQYKDVAPIFYQRCTSCHHTGAHKYPFMNYTQTSQMASLIHIALTTGEMPPWKADTAYTRFQHERLITASEKQTILDWISAGAAKGDTTLAPAAPQYPNQYQLTGTPDLVLSIGNFTSTSTVTDKYYCFSIPTGLAEDRIIRAFEVVPGNKEIVHHAVIMADNSGTYQSDLSGFCYDIPGDAGIGTYAPGARATVFPAQAPLKAGITLKAGSNVIIQLHYPAGSAGKVDSTKIRIYFYPKSTTNVRQIYSDWPLQNWNMMIPANQVSTYHAWYPPSGTLPFDFSLYAIMPHSHMLCKSILVYAVKPGVDTIPLIRINNWDFEWQDYYFFRKLIRIPAGYRVFSEHVYDNTVNNHHNPHYPPKTAYAGTDTDDEMLFDGMLFLLYQPGDELIDVESIIAADPLLGIPERSSSEILPHFRVFPNPAERNVSFSFSLNNSGSVSAEITDLAGRIVLHHTLGLLQAGLHEWQADISGLAAGTYLCRVKSNNQVLIQKLAVE